MAQAAAKRTSSRNPSPKTQQLVIMKIDEQLFGIPVLSIQDVLRPPQITNIPLSPPEIAGALNLRGRIVTTIDVRARLNMPTTTDINKSMCIVVQHGDEYYSMLVDAVDEVMDLPVDNFEPNPSNLNSHWKEVAFGIYRLEGKLLVMLNIDKLLTF